MASCKKCSAKLVWKQPYKKGDRPVNPNGTPHNCMEKSAPKIISKGLSKHDYKHCDLCPSDCGWLRLDKPEEIAQHMKTFHPNQELREWDYFVLK